MGIISTLLWSRLKWICAGLKGDASDYFDAMISKSQIFFLKDKNHTFVSTISQKNLLPVLS